MKKSICLFLGAAARLVASQTDNATPSQTSTPTSASSASRAATTGGTFTDPVIQSLWAGAESLLSSYYPSSSISDVASLTWPTSVILGSSTVSVPWVSPTTTLASVLSSASNTKPVETSAATNPKSTPKSDKRLGIIIGAVLGIISLGLLAFLMWWVHHRRRRTGSFFRHRPTSPSPSEIRTWRSPNSSTSQFPEKYMTLSAPAPPLPAMNEHTAYAPHHMHHDSTSTSTPRGRTSNPFYTPFESRAELSSHPSRRNSATSLHRLRDDTHSPLYNPAVVAMADGPVSPISPAAQHQQFPFLQQPSRLSPYEQHDGRNPFASEEDEDSFAPPRIPTRSPHRRSSPHVHYPTQPEVSGFDFDLHGGRRPWENEEQGDVGQAWRRARSESVQGRHELA